MNTIRRIFWHPKPLEICVDNGKSYAVVRWDNKQKQLEKAKKLERMRRRCGV